MSGLPQTLTPPADHSKAVLAISVGVGLAIFIFPLLSYKLPVPGDNIHSLPFGGHYRDGTKVISYNSPRAQEAGTKWAPLLAILLLTLAIYVASKRDLTRHRELHSCSCCAQLHPTAH